jgi:hypothetical protein
LGGVVAKAEVTMLKNASIMTMDGEMQVYVGNGMMVMEGENNIAIGRQKTICASTRTRRRQSLISLLARFCLVYLISLIKQVGVWIEFGVRESPTDFFVETTLFRQRQQCSYT